MSALACLLCGLYIETGVSVHSAPADPAITTMQAADGSDVLVYRFRQYDINFTRNPYGVVTVGNAWPLGKKIELSTSVRHESSLATRQDHGINSLQLTVRWSPWK